MLVLSRKVGEQLVIGDNIRVVVHRVAGNRVTIGIEAPNDVRIVRGELQLHTDFVAAEEHTLEFTDSSHHSATAVATLPRRKGR